MITLENLLNSIKLPTSLILHVKKETTLASCNLNKNTKEKYKDYHVVSISPYSLDDYGSELELILTIEK